MAKLSKSAKRAKQALERAGFPVDVLEMPESTHTADEAATAIGCEVSQIVKSLVFKGANSGTPLLVVASGSNRVREARIEDVVGEPVGLADAKFVREATGFSIGGVPPAGHASPLRTLIDVDLLEHREIWAAAGTPRAVFRLTPDDLARITGGEIVAVT